MSDKIIFLGQVTSYRDKKDHTLSITFNTQEVTEEQVIRVRRMLDKFGAIALKTGDDKLDDLSDDLDSIDTDIYDKPKSLSKRLRGTLYRVWESNRKDEISFEEYYRMKMNKIIDYYKDQIID